jgi:hypothetical protein
MFRTLRSSLAVLALALCACGSPTSPTPPNGPFTVHGTVVDFATGGPVAGARLQFSVGSAASIREAVSDANGRYSLGLDHVAGTIADAYTIAIDGLQVGEGQIAGAWWRGDLVAHGEGCVSRYGVVLDNTTGRPVTGATVTVGAGQAVTDRDGWYRIDLGCPPGGSIGFSTSFAQVTHPGYAQRQRVVGRGISSVVRLDIDLTPM